MEKTEERKNEAPYEQRFDKFHLLTCIIAAASVTLACIIRRESLFTMALWASVAIMVFYVLGNLVRYYFVTRVFPPPEAEGTDESTASDGTQETDADGNIIEAPHRSAKAQTSIDDYTGE
jgi:hypothetical protein